MTYNKLNKVDTLLLSHNISPALKGYTFIKYILENKKISVNTKLYDLYNEVSKEFNITPIAARECIKYAFKNSDFTKKSIKKNLILLSYHINL